MKESLQGLQRDVFLNMVQYLDVRSLCGIQKTSKQLRVDADLALIVWRLMVIRRWNVKDSVLRSIGASDWKQAYQILHLRHKQPRGAYFEKHNVIFAKGKSCGMYSWLTLGHTVNGRLKHNHVEIRMCLQNVFNDLAEVDLRSVQVLVRSEGETESDDCSDLQTISLQALRTGLASVIAFNGSRVQQDAHMLTLCPSDFAVVSCQVRCPDDMLHEVDFLTRSQTVIASMRTVNFDSTSGGSVERHVGLDARFHDELSVWDHFDELPGGIILLNDLAIETF
jgi:hypothetical protein